MAAPASNSTASTNTQCEEQKNEVFEWIELRKQLDSTTGSPDGTIWRDKETTSEKFQRKVMQNPLVPVGCALTTICLAAGLVSFGRKNSHASQMLMRGRILAQGFTVVGLIGGIMYGLTK